MDTRYNKEKFCMLISFIATTVSEAKAEIQYQPKYDLTEQFQANFCVKYYVLIIIL